jgi:hypothetical protein
MNEFQPANGQPAGRQARQMPSSRSAAAGSLSDHGNESDSFDRARRRAQQVVVAAGRPVGCSSSSAQISAGRHPATSSVVLRPPRSLGAGRIVRRRPAGKYLGSPASSGVLKRPNEESILDGQLVELARERPATLVAACRPAAGGRANWRAQLRNVSASAGGARLARERQMQSVRRGSGCGGPAGPASPCGAAACLRHSALRSILRSNCAAASLEADQFGQRATSGGGDSFVPLGRPQGEPAGVAECQKGS